MVIEVESPCTPASGGCCGSSVAEVTDILTHSISTVLQWCGIGNAHDCEDIVLVLRNTQCTNGVRELVHKLSGVGSRVDLPDLGRVDQGHKNLAVRANSDVLDPLQ
jgi:hypothetical protein